MTLEKLIKLLETEHELVIFGEDESYICSCNSDSIVMKYLADWIVLKFKTGSVNPYNERAGLKITIKENLPF